MSSIANILLEVTGDAGDAKEELVDVASELAAFGRETAEASADLDTDRAQAALDGLKARLAEFSADDVTANVNLDIAKAQAQIAVLQAELSTLDGEDVNIDVDVRRGVVEQIASLTSQVDHLGESLGETSSGGLADFFGGAIKAADGASVFGVGLSSIVEVGPLVLAVVVSILGQLAAVVATAGAAAGAIGALAIAFGATLLPAIALGVGAIANFKAEADTAGTAAHALKETFGDVADTFKTATKGGSNALFQGLSDSLREIDPLVKSLRPAFTALGEAGGDAFRHLAEQFSSPAWKNFFTFAIESLTALTPLFARSFGAFAKVLANIATAAMPLLIAGLQAVAGFLESLADKSSDIGSVRKAIGGMAESLSAVGQLLGGLADLTEAFVQAFAPFGNEIVKSLGEGAEALADWLRSSEGTEKLKQFFEDTGPLAAELATLFLQVSLALIQIGEAVAPAITPLVHDFNQVLEVVNKVLSFINDKVGPGFKAFLGLFAISPVAAFAKNFGAIEGVAQDVLHRVEDAASKAWEAIKTGLSAAGDGLADAARSVFNHVLDTIRSKVATARDIGTAILHAVQAGFNASRGAVVAVAKAIITQIVNALKSRVDQARNIGEAILNAVKGGFNTVRGALVGAVRDVIQAVLGALRGAIDTARNVGESIINAVKGGINSARGAVTDAIRDLTSAALDILRNLIDAARAAGEALINAVAGGIKAGAAAVISAVQGIYDQIKSIVEAPLHVHIDVPHVDVPGFASGVRDRSIGGLSRVGEMGEELMYVPTGADVYNAGETRKILRALATGAKSSAAAIGGGGVPALAGAGGGGGTTIQVTPIAGGGSPDPEVLAAQISTKLRQRQGT